MSGPRIAARWGWAKTTPRTPRPGWLTVDAAGLRWEPRPVRWRFLYEPAPRAWAIEWSAVEEVLTSRGQWRRNVAVHPRDDAESVELGRVRWTEAGPAFAAAGCTERRSWRDPSWQVITPPAGPTGPTD